MKVLENRSVICFGTKIEKKTKKKKTKHKMIQFQ